MSNGDPRAGFNINTEARRFKVTSYINTLIITGHAYMSFDTRTTSQRASDFLRCFPEKHMTLSDARIVDRSTKEVVDEMEYIIINLENADAIYAEEIGDSETDAPNP